VKAPEESAVAVALPTLTTALATGEPHTFITLPATDTTAGSMVMAADFERPPMLIVKVAVVTASTLAGGV
jgi:hypothetical protein